MKISKKNIGIFCGVLAAIVLIVIIVVVLSNAGKSDKKTGGTTVNDETTSSLVTTKDQTTTQQTTSDGTIIDITEQDITTEEMTTTEQDTTTTMEQPTTEKPTPKPTQPQSSSQKYYDPYTGQEISKEEYEKIIKEQEKHKYDHIVQKWIDPNTGEEKSGYFLEKDYSMDQLPKLQPWQEWVLDNSGNNSSAPGVGYVGNYYYIHTNNHYVFNSDGTLNFKNSDIVDYGNSEFLNYLFECPDIINLKNSFTDQYITRITATNLSVAASMAGEKYPWIYLFFDGDETYLKIYVDENNNFITKNVSYYQGMIHKDLAEIIDKYKRLN